VPDDIRKRTMAKVGVRLFPYMIIAFCVAFLDRVNISFAALQMNRDLGLSMQTFGFAAGILFVGYTIFQLPSNLILDRIGARVWLACTMAVWGLLSAGIAFVSGAHSLYAMLFFLGIAEAGFSPGLLLYLTRWFPAEERAKAVTIFLLGSPVAVVFGAPLSTWILTDFNHVLGLAGWKWLFISEGFPAIILGIFTFVWLVDRPRQARWLEPAEREWLSNLLENEMRLKQRKELSHWGDVFRNVPTLLLALAKMCILLSFFGITFWLPQILKGMGGRTDLQVGVITSIPYAFAAVGSILVARRSDRTGERVFHVAIPAFVGAIGFVLAGLTKNPVFALLGICTAATGLWASNTVFWTLPAKILTGTTEAAGIAFINLVGDLGGFFGPFLSGVILAVTHSYGLVLVTLGGVLALSGIILILIRGKLGEPISPWPHSLVASRIE